MKTIGKERGESGGQDGGRTVALELDRVFSRVGVRRMGDKDHGLVDGAVLRVKKRAAGELPVGKRR